MSGRTTDGRTPDDAIRAMLEVRAGRAGPPSLDPASIVAAAGRRDRPMRPWGRVVPRLSLGVASVAVILVASMLVLAPILNRPVGSATPAGSPGASAGSVASSSVPPQASALPELRALMPVELGDLVRSRSADLAGAIVAVRGRLEIDPSAPCPQRAGICANTLLADAGGGFHVRPSGDIGPGPWDGSGSIAGMFALRLTADTEGGRPVVDFVGTLTTPTDSRLTNGRIAWSVDEIRAGAAHVEGAYAAVDGWLVRDPFHPCPSVVRPPGAVSYGCPTDDWLTGTAFQPLQPDGSSIGPAGGLSLSSGSYDRWAPSPAAFGRDSVGVEPRHATYLLRLVSNDCGPTAFCIAVPRWRIVGRLDPIAVPPAVPTPTAPPVGGDTYPGGIPRTIGIEPVLVGLDAQARMANTADPGPFLIAGWLSAGQQMCTGGLIGPRDPNPLAVHGCARYAIAGVPGIPYYPPSLTMPDADGPIVLRAHVGDPGAATCWDPVACRERLVMDELAWFGDASTAAAPIGPSAAIGLVRSLGIADERVQPDRSQAYVSEDLFAFPIVCSAPLPTLTFAIHGDPRLVLVGVFPDTTTRERVQASLDPSAALGCLTGDVARTGEPRWIGRDNVLLLVVTGPVTAARIEANLDATPGGPGWKPVPLPDATLDRSLETMRDYLAARAAGERDHATGYRLEVPRQDGFDGYAEWLADTLRRRSAAAIDGTITLVSANPSAADIGSVAAAQIPAGAALWLYRVDYLDATDPTLGSETFLVIDDPASTFADWQLVRVAGAPYPREAVRPAVTPPPGAEPSLTVLDPGANGSGDTPCVPAPSPCG